MEGLLFYVAGAIALLAALLVVTRSNASHALLYMLVSVLAMAVVFFSLGAPFAAALQIVVYAGAIMVLFLFVVMMLDINIEEVRARVTRYAFLGGIVAGVVVFEIVAVVWTNSLGTPVDQAVAPHAADYSNTAELGKVLYTQYVYPFELAAVLLLIAIVAAISLTMRKRAGLKQQDIAAQVAVRREDRVRIIKMPAEGATREEKAP